jgi:hypothetical protein
MDVYDRGSLGIMRHFIFVIGVNYSSFKSVYRTVCYNRMNLFEFNNRKNEDIVFHIFDVQKGEIVTREITFPSGIKKVKTTKPTPSPFKTITKDANYNRRRIGNEIHHDFKDGQTDVMSILHVYETVQKIGANEPNTLFELSFFSHGWMGGPILVNSSDNGIFGPEDKFLLVPDGARDPDDMDPRTKDFREPTMFMEELSNFQKAFSPSGYIWNWGCTFPRTTFRILHKMVNHHSYKNSGLGDDVIFKFNKLPDDEGELLDSVLSPELGGHFPDRKNIEIKFKFLKHFFCKRTTATYNHVIAKSAKVKTFAALVGTYSDFKTAGHISMHVPGFLREKNFYKNYLGFGFDPEGNGYGEYKPNFTCTVPTSP